MILVVGATGQLGGSITKRLLEQGKEVRILVRRDSPSEQLAQQGMFPIPVMAGQRIRFAFRDLREGKAQGVREQGAGRRAQGAKAQGGRRKGQGMHRTVVRGGPFAWSRNPGLQSGGF